MMRLTKILALVLACVSVPGGALPVAAAPRAAHTHALSGLPVIPLTIVSHRQRHRFRVEVAASQEQQARGLMFRKAMGADEGMIFPMSPPRTAAFWMHNTVLPLDLVFIAPDGRILTIAADAVPYSDAQIPSGGIVKAVLELNGGRAAALGIHVGDRVSW
jgi:hypothetical protein